MNINYDYGTLEITIPFKGVFNATERIVALLSAEKVLHAERSKLASANCPECIKRKPNDPNDTRHARCYMCGVVFCGPLKEI